MSQDAHSAPTIFSMSFNRLTRLVMTPILACPRRCRVTVSPAVLEVVMGARGWAFTARVPRTSIVDVARVSGPVFSWGAHGWRGRWLVNGSSRGLVQVNIDPTTWAHCCGIPLRLRQLIVSVDDPDRFAAALDDASTTRR